MCHSYTELAQNEETKG
jgi:hypothetical protein